MTIAACTSGVDKGIRLVSELNLWSCAAMMLYILVTGKTAFLLNAIGREHRPVHLHSARAHPVDLRLRQTTAPPGWARGPCSSGPSGWPGVPSSDCSWPASPVVAPCASSSSPRSRAPVLCDFIIVTIFGNSALSEVFDGNSEFAKLAIDSPEQGWYALPRHVPRSDLPHRAGHALGSALLSHECEFGRMVMSNFSSTIPNPEEDGAKWLRIFWAVVTAVLTIAMLVAGGVTTMEYATLIFALPVTVIAYLVMASFSKVLRMETSRARGQDPQATDDRRPRWQDSGEDLAAAPGDPALLPVEEVRRQIRHRGGRTCPGSRGRRVP